MARYVDGFVLTVPKKNLAAYRRMSQQAGKVWKKYGALQYRECIGDDLKHKGVVPFTRLTKAKRSEAVFFSFIVFRSKADRDRINARVMKDPVIAKSMQEKMPFDSKRMAYGGFKVQVDL